MFNVLSAWLIDWCLTPSLTGGWADCYIEKWEMDKVGRFCLATGNQRTLLPRRAHHELNQLFFFVQRDRHSLKMEQSITYRFRGWVQKTFVFVDHLWKMYCYPDQHIDEYGTISSTGQNSLLQTVCPFKKN
jgi:hypothetical protein